jgi:hypothetical protein
MVHTTKYAGEFVARMEDILETCALSYDSKITLVCMDEKPAIS